MIFGEMGGKEYSEKTAEIIDQEIKALMDEAHSATRKAVEDNRQKLQDVAQALLKYETLTGEEVRRIIDGQPLEKTTVDDLLQREQARSPFPASPARPAGGAPKVPPLPQPG